MNVEPVDLGQELGQGVQLRLALAPVVLRLPVAREVLHYREPDALGVVGDRLALGPPGRADPPAQVGEIRLGKADLEGADRGVVAAARLLRAFSHCFVPPSGVPLCLPSHQTAVTRTRVNPLPVPWPRPGYGGPARRACAGATAARRR